jgi:hypothetical protein
MMIGMGTPTAQRIQPLPIEAILVATGGLTNCPASGSVLQQSAVAVDAGLAQKPGHEF